MISQDLQQGEVKQHISSMLDECNVDEYDARVWIQKGRLHTYIQLEGSHAKVDMSFPPERFRFISCT